MKLYNVRKNIGKILAIVLIVGVVFHFNSVTAQYKEIHAKNQKAMNPRGNATAGKLKDGTHKGVGKGYGGDIVVEVKVSKGNISGISVVSATKEDAPYYNMAVSVLKKIADKGSTDVDNVSGATYTTNGIKKAVNSALEKAK